MLPALCLLCLFVLHLIAERPMYSVEYKDITVDGFVCDGPNKAIVFYPTNGTKQQVFPVVSFVHGYNSGGNDSRLTYWYGALLGNISAYGFVVIAPLTSVTVECPRFSEDQLRALQADFKGNGIPADPSRAAVLGQSAGGAAAMQSAAKEGYNIKAAVLLHPAGGSAAEAQNVRVPVLFGTGTQDPIAPFWHVARLYFSARVSDKVIGVMKGAGHNEAAGLLARLAGRWPHWVGPFLLCHLNNNADECTFFYSQFCSCHIDKFPICRVPRHPPVDDDDFEEIRGNVVNAAQ